MSESGLYFVANPSTNRYWGVYRRKRTNRHGLFRLATTCMARQTAIDHAIGLLKQSPEYEYEVQSDNHPLPDAINP